MQKRSRKVLLLSEKEKVLNFNKERKKSHTEVTKIYSKNKSSVKLQKGGKKTQQCANFAVTPQAAKFTTAVHDAFS